MRGYVERMEWLEKCGDGPVTYDAVLDSFRNDADALDVDNPRPARGMCQRCLRAIPVASLTDGVCADRHDCSRALLRLNFHRKGTHNG